MTQNFCMHTVKSIRWVNANSDLSIHLANILFACQFSLKPYFIVGWFNEFPQLIFIIETIKINIYKLCLNYHDCNVRGANPGHQ